MIRYLYKYILQDLRKKMVFLGGPRQVGKTTLSKIIGQENYKGYEYLNWDLDEDRLAIQQKHWRDDASLVIFDELHKYPRWKQWIKGVSDTAPPNQQYMVTGSARLDVYKRGGDSLMGRYHYWRLHPLTLDELPPSISSQEGYDRLLKFGGFPEPFLDADEREAKRWRRERFNRIIKEDIRDLEEIRNIQLLQMLTDELRSRAGSLITISNLAKDLQISHKTVKSWLTLIEKMYIAFAIYPFSKNIPRSIQKPPKVYFYDNADLTTNDGSRLENLVATHLLKRLHFLEDYNGDKCSLHYIRDRDDREVDFVTVINDEVHELIEVKLSETKISSSLKYYAEKLKPKHVVQLVGNLKRPYDANGVRVTSPIHYFSTPLWADAT